MGIVTVTHEEREALRGLVSCPGQRCKPVSKSGWKPRFPCPLTKGYFIIFIFSFQPFMAKQYPYSNPWKN